MTTERFLRKRFYLYCLSSVWILLFMSLPAVVAQTQVLSGGGFEGFIMDSAAQFVQPEHAWMVSSSTAGQTFSSEFYDIDGAGMLLVQGLR